MSTELAFSQVLRDWAEIFMRRSFHDFKRFMDDAGLSFSQVSALMQLYHRHGCGVSDIGEHLGVTSPAASQMVDRLVQQGLLTRVEDPRDRRGKQLSLTPHGRSLIESGIEARRHWMEQLTEALTPQEQQTITGALALLTQAARRLESTEEREIP